MDGDRDETRDRKGRHDMRATVMRAAGDVRIEDVSVPSIATA
jgi:hypothetical protein